MTSAQDLFLTLEQYLELETASSVRHEYVDGRIFAMVGATEKHNVLVSNIHALLHAMARKSGCRAYVTDMKLKILQSVYYPDVMVSCEPYSAKSLYKEKPCLVVEVLSPSTENVDREKLAYKQLQTLTDYLVVYQDGIKVAHYARHADEWQMHTVTTGAIRLACLGEAELELSAFYAGTDD